MIILFPSAYAGVAEWQTQQTQNLPIAISCGFKSHLRHHIKTPIVSSKIYCRGFSFCLKFPSILLLVQHLCNTLHKKCTRERVHFVFFYFAVNFISLFLLPIVQRHNPCRGLHGSIYP